MKIDIRDNIPDEIAIELVGVVIRQGRISKQGDKMCYCWATKVIYDNEDYTSPVEPLDVYRGKTTLEITYKDSIPRDSVVVLKDEFKK